MNEPARRFVLQAFTTAQWPVAQAMLERGFPDDPPALWRKGLARRLAVPPQTGDDTAGLILSDGDGPAGMMLSYTTLRPGDDAPGRVTNLSSWFIDPRARFKSLNDLVHLPLTSRFNQLLRRRIFSIFDASLF